MACYVFVKIKTVGWKRTGEYSYTCIIDGTEALAWSVDKDWIFLSGESDGAVYYRIVSANKKISANVLANDGAITVSKDLTRTKLEKLTADMAIDIGATAVQYYGFPENSTYTPKKRAEAVWNLVENG